MALTLGVARFQEAQPFIESSGTEVVLKHL
jgi:hypothetical protein